MKSITPFTSLSGAIQLDKPSLLNILNQQVDQIIRKLPPQPVEIGYVQIKKEGLLHVDLNGTQVQLEIPLTLHFKGEKLYSSLGAQASIRLYFKSDISFKPYWQLTTRTKLVRYEWLDKPDVQLRKFNIPVKRLADQLLEKNKGKLEQQIDGAISNYWSNSQVDKFAESFFQKQHQLKPKWPLYIRFTPERINVAPARNEDTAIHSILHSDLQIDLTTEPSRGKKSALPTPSFEDLEDLKTSGVITVLLSYKGLQQLFQHQLVGQSFSFRDYTIKVKAISLEKVTNQIRIIVSTSGSLEGQILIEGVPQYSERTNRLTMDMHNFQVQTDSFWKQSIAKLISGRIKNTIEERLHLNLDDLPKREEIKKLRNFSPVPEIKAAVDVQEVKLSKFVVGENEISCLLHAQLEINLHFGSK